MTNSLFLNARRGPLLQGELVPLNCKGKLRVSYNWLYSALNCNPDDSSPFVWTIRKVDDTHVSLSPRDRYSGMSLYASIRDDLSWYAQIQAPYSADWIRDVGRDETCALESQDLLILSFKGLNDQYLAVNETLSSHAGYAAYRLQSLGAADPRARLWFLGVSAVLQPDIAVPLCSALTEADIRRAYAANGLTPAATEISSLQRQLLS